MPSALFARAREAWFHKRDLTGVALYKGQKPFTIPYAKMLEFGGPREINCEYCAAQEWYSRITKKSCYVKHPCAYPKEHAVIAPRCKYIITPAWAHLWRNYNFTLTNDPKLPGLRCLFVAADTQRLVKHGAHPGFMIWRKRLSMYRTTMCLCSDIKSYNLKDFDLIIMPISGLTPIIPQAGNPPIFLYGHDHHPPDLHARAIKLFEQAPAALITPYPNIWTKEFAISNKTKVIFAPYLSDPLWSSMDTSFSKRKIDVMVIGAANSVYPERRLMHDMLRRQEKVLPFRLKLWEAPKPIPVAENISALKYKAPPLALWSQFLAQSKICIFGQDMYGYLVNKYAEVPGACSLMVAPNLPECKDVGLVPNVNFVALERPIEHKLIPQLTNLVKQFDKVGSAIALRGLEWFKSQCSKLLYDKFWTDIDSVVEESVHVNPR